MSNFNEQDQHSTDPSQVEKEISTQDPTKEIKKPIDSLENRAPTDTGQPVSQTGNPPTEGRPVERKAPGRTGARGTAAMDAQTRQEVARKGGLAVSRNKQHMAEIGRKGGQSVSKNREHMALIGRKGGAASRGHR